MITTSKKPNKMNRDGNITEWHLKKKQHPLDLKFFSMPPTLILRSFTSAGTQNHVGLSLLRCESPAVVYLPEQEAFLAGGEKKTTTKKTRCTITIKAHKAV